MCGQRGCLFVIYVRPIMKALNRYLMSLSQRQVTLKDVCVQQCLNSQKSGKSNYTLKRAFNVIQGHPFGDSINPERGFVVIYNNVDIISETTKIKQSNKFVDFNHPTPVRRKFSQWITSEYLQIIYIFLETGVIGYIFAADSMGLCLLLFTQLSLKVKLS